MIMLSPIGAGLEKGSSFPVAVVFLSGLCYIFDQSWKTNITLKHF